MNNPVYVITRLSRPEIGRAMPGDPFEQYDGPATRCTSATEEAMLGEILSAEDEAIFEDMRPGQVKIVGGREFFYEA